MELLVGTGIGSESLALLALAKPERLGEFSRRAQRGGRWVLDRPCLCSIAVELVTHQSHQKRMMAGCSCSMCISSARIRSMILLAEYGMFGSNVCMSLLSVTRLMLALRM